jgi:tetratricopeptide (TPR) repeat protein
VAALVNRQLAGADRDTRRPAQVGTNAATVTSRENLARVIADMEARVRKQPLDRDAALLLADALLRQARIADQPVLIERAVQVVEPQARNDPDDYEARRMLGTVYAAAHRFREAIREASRARDQHPEDPWNYGVIGDAHLEHGEREQAFRAFQQMLDVKPTSAAYARASYALELQGKLPDAVEAMTLAVDAANPRDPESIAWFRAQLGNLHVKAGRLPEAQLEYAWADRAFPGHPFTRDGITRLQQAQGAALRR